jgi:hypothetical protein
VNIENLSSNRVQDSQLSMLGYQFELTGGLRVLDSGVHRETIANPQLGVESVPGFLVLRVVRSALGIYQLP